MGLRINQNIFSLLVNRNLDRVSDKLENSFQRLSSGERIVKAGDDPAGLAVSQILRNEIRGLQQNIRNANDGISVTSVAEGALGEITNILQRLRELGIQASSATLSDTNRQQIQTEVDNLLNEINRIAGETQFNGRNLLNGSLTQTKIQVGTQSAEFIPMALPDARPMLLGRQSTATGQNPASAAAILGGGDLLINGIAVPASTADGASTVLPSASAIAKANSINSIKFQTGVQAKAESAVYTVPGAAIGALTLDGTTSSLVINGVNLGAINITAGDTAGTLRAAINSRTNITGVAATLDDTGELILTAADGRNIQLTTTGSIADDLGLALADSDLTGFVQSGIVTLTSSQTINVGGTLGLIGFGAGQAVTVVDPDSAVSFIKMSSIENAQAALGAIDKSIEQILAVRANMGAIQNRLESSVRAIRTNIEELSSSNSRILDTDFAQESARMAQLQILQEAGIAMLTQANVLPRTALNLLQPR